MLAGKAAVDSYGASSLHGRYQAALRAVAAADAQLAGGTRREQAQLCSILRTAEDRLGP